MFCNLDSVKVRNERPQPKHVGDQGSVGSRCILGDYVMDCAQVVPNCCERWQQWSWRLARVHSR